TCLIGFRGCDLTRGAARRAVSQSRVSIRNRRSAITLAQVISYTSRLATARNTLARRGIALVYVAGRNRTNAEPTEAAVEATRKARQNLGTPKRQAKIADQAAENVDFTAKLPVFAVELLDRRDFERIFQRFLGFCGLLFRFGRF
ncbi:MAG TPA: hypothetical protein VHB99_09515, partial [Pirellulales bacterium]|nr:hypothetical protein [Pirellulales bacterium]